MQPFMASETNKGLGSTCEKRCLKKMIYKLITRYIKKHNMTYILYISCSKFSILSIPRYESAIKFKAKFASNYATDN